MRIRLDLIEDEPFVWNATESIASEALERSDLLGLTAIEWSGSVTKAHPGYRLVANLKYGQTLACGRCLTDCEVLVEGTVELVALTESAQPMAGEVQLEESDLGMLHLEDTILDTDPILMEQLELNLPMNVLCRPDCAGLCPHCGANRNEEPACCDAQDVDPRWQGLRDLKLS